MKKLIMFLFISSICFAQPEHPAEVIIELLNFGSSWDVTFKVEALSTLWDENYQITDLHAEESVRVNGVQIVPPYIPKGYFDLIVDPIAGEYPIIALGLYKISAIENNVVMASFYMDWRTSGYGSSPDVIFKYDYTNNIFRNAANTQTIDGTYQTIWNLVPYIGLETFDLEDYFDNCLVTIKSETGNHPRLIWGPLPYHPNGHLEEFRIYRAGNHVPGQACGSFTQINEVDDQVYSYVDESLTLGTGQNAYCYYIKGYILDQSEGSFETSPTNSVEVVVTPPSKMVIGEVNSSYQYFLDQNYPNPFNPSTRINYTLAKDEFVTLGIYNILGEQVALLVSEPQIAGKYSYEFNGFVLPSGIYLYKISSASFTAVRKMSLLK